MWRESLGTTPFLYPSHTLHSYCVLAENRINRRLFNILISLGCRDDVANPKMYLASIL